MTYVGAQRFNNPLVGYLFNQDPTEEDKIYKNAFMVNLESYLTNDEKMARNANENPPKAASNFLYNSQLFENSPLDPLGMPQVGSFAVSFNGSYSDHVLVVTGVDHANGLVKIAESNGGQGITERTLKLKELQRYTFLQVRSEFHQGQVRNAR